MDSKQSGGNAGLDTSADISISGCVRDSADKCPGDPGYVAPTLPPPPHAGGTDSFILTENPSTKLTTQFLRSSSNPGILLSVHSDVSIKLSITYGKAEHSTSILIEILSIE